MKNLLLSSFILISIIFISLLLSSFNQDKENNGDMLIIRTVEIWGIKPSKMIVTHINGESKTIPLKTFMIKNIPSNMTILQNELDGFLRDGYKLISSTGGNSDGVFLNTYILRKE